MYHCSICHQVFESFSILGIHRKAEHVQPKQKLQCQKCNQTININMFERHINSCKKDKNNKCLFCNKFTYKKFCDRSCRTNYERKDKEQKCSQLLSVFSEFYETSKLKSICERLNISLKFARKYLKKS